MTAVERAVQSYRIAAADAEWHMSTQQCWLCLQGRYCRIGRHLHQAVDSASIALDLAVAVESEERIRASVAW